MGNLVGTKDPSKKKLYTLWLVTNKHILEAFPVVYVKLNSAADPKSKDYPLLLVVRNGKKLWVGHPADGTDVAAIWLNAGFLAQEQLRFAPILSDVHTCSKEKMKTGILTRETGCSS